MQKGVKIKVITEQCVRNSVNSVYLTIIEYAIREDSINCRIQCIFSIRGINGDSVGGGFKAGETNEKHF